MKLATKDRTIDMIAPLGVPTVFSSVMNGKTARTLSSSLYKDKIRAVIREVSCNAYDAHAMVGKEHVPFEIHLPNALEPYFSVKDNGPGMSFDMMTVFTTYFASTKNDSNDQIGGFGLGCKAPLCLVDSFVVISTTNGVKTSYCVYFNEKDIPELLPMARENTNEENGVEIKIDVPAELFSEFNRKAKIVLKHFKTTPIVVGAPDFVIEHKTPVIDNEMYTLYESEKNAHWNSTAVALMGCVAYPIDPSVLTQPERQLLMLDLVLHFNIGELDVTAGREELSYDKNTINAVKKKLNDVREHLTKYVNDKFEKCKTEYDARALFAKFYPTGLLQILFPNSKIPFKDGFISGTHFSILFDEYPNTTFLLTDEYSSSGSTKLRENVHAEAFNFRYNSECVIIDDCDGKFIQSKLKRFFIDKGITGYSNRQVLVVRSTEPSEIVDMLSAISGVKVNFLSELPKSDPVSRTPVSVYEFCHNGSWNKTFANIDDGGLYLPMNAGVVRDDAGNKIPDFPKMYVLALSLNLLKREKIYGVPKSLLSKIADDAAWINFYEYVRAKFDEAIKQFDWKTEARKNIALKAFVDVFPNVNSKLNFIADIMKKGASEHDIKKFLNAVKDAQNAKKYADYTIMAKFLYDDFETINADLMTASNTLIDSWKNILKGYPMLSMLFEIDDLNLFQIGKKAEYLEKFRNYISLVDQKCDTVKSVIGDAK